MNFKGGEVRVEVKRRENIRLIFSVSLGGVGKALAYKRLVFAYRPAFGI